MHMDDRRVIIEDFFYLRIGVCNTIVLDWVRMGTFKGTLAGIPLDRLLHK